MSLLIWSSLLQEAYELTTEAGVVQTLEGAFTWHPAAACCLDGWTENVDVSGPVSYPGGYYILTGPKGERYPVSPGVLLVCVVDPGRCLTCAHSAKFMELKDDLGGGRCTPKKILKVRENKREDE